ncbi:MAG TPA: hypothetical protein VLD36_18865 [Burkholderiales bacterium]|nr:hypothetical protein [Burkholderiales bacterium]
MAVLGERAMSWGVPHVAGYYISEDGDAGTSGSAALERAAGRGVN